MARTKRVHTCFHCKTSFTWENTTGSIRQHNVDDGSVHYCKNGLRTTGPKTDFIPESERNFGGVELPKSETEKPSQTQQLPEPEFKPQPEKTQPQPITSESTSLYSIIRPNVQAEISQTETALKAEMLAEIAKLKQQLSGIQRVEHTLVIHDSNGTELQRFDSCHVQMPKLMRYLRLKRNVLLVGPAGTGKTTAGFKAAEILGLKFCPISVGPQTSKSDFFGFTDASGKAVWTVIRDAFVNGGLLLVDEMDSASAGALTYLNSLIANDYVSFPADHGDENKTVTCKKHENFRIIAAANTFGHGGNRMHPDRKQLDMATLNRFVGIEWLYDTDLEQKLGATQPDFVKLVWKLRAKQNELGIRACFGTRNIENGVALLDDGCSLEDVYSDVLFFGVSPDDRRKLEAGIR